MRDEFNNQSVLITGASGFIGSNLTRRLVELGAEVNVFVREQSDLWRIEDLLQQVKVWRTAINESEKVCRYVGEIRPARVFHLAAWVNPKRSFEMMETMVEVNLKGTLNMFKSVQGLPLDSFVQIGTCEEYGDGNAPFQESQRESPVSPYSASKAAATHFCQLASRVFGLPVVTVRPFLTYGPYQFSRMLIPSLIQHCLRKEPEFLMTSGEQTREFNYVSDVVEGILNASLRPDLAGEILNLGNGKEYKIIDVARLIVKLTGSSIQLKTGSKKHRGGEVLRFYSSTEKSDRLLGSEQHIPLEQGLQQTIQWFNENFSKVVTRDLPSYG